MFDYDDQNGLHLNGTKTGKWKEKRRFSMGMLEMCAYDTAAVEGPMPTIAFKVGTETRCKFVAQVILRFRNLHLRPVTLQVVMESREVSVSLQSRHDVLIVLPSRSCTFSVLVGNQIFPLLKDVILEPKPAA